MSLSHSIYVGKKQVALGQGYLYKIQQGGHAAVAIRPQTFTAWWRDDIKQAFVWDGNVYIPHGCKIGSNNGWLSYNPELGEFVHSLQFTISTQRLIPFGDRIVFWRSASIGWGYSPKAMVDQVSTLARSAHDYCIVGDTIYALSVYLTHRYVLAYQYPFTSPPVYVTGYAPTDSDARRIEELNDDVYCLSVSSAGALALYKLTLGVWGIVGSGGTVGHTVIATYFSQFGFWKYNSKLFCAVMGTAGTQLVTIYEINPSTGTFTDRSAWMPPEWKVAAGADTIIAWFEIQDYIGNSEQMFLMRAGGLNTGYWELYEFLEGTFIPIDNAGSGGGASEIIMPYSGVVYDETAKGAHIKSAVDSSPSNYLTTEIAVFDLDANSTANIDPRYRENGEEPPPYNVCTEKAGVGSEGKTALSSIPSGITALADLSDDFADASLDTDLWEAVEFGIYQLKRDYGSLGQTTNADNYIEDVVEETGAIRFKTTAVLAGASEGVAIKSRHSIRDAFQIDFTIANPENLRSGDPMNNTLLVLVKISSNEGYGFVMWHDNSPDQINVQGIYMDLDTDWQVTADLAQVIDGDVIRIARDGSDVWTVTHDPGGSPTDLLTGIIGQLDLSQPVQIWAGAYAKVGYAAAWYDGSGDAPGYSDIAVSGAGSVGKYDGGKKHDFMWNHVADLGADKTTVAQLYVDTE